MGRKSPLEIHREAIVVDSHCDTLMHLFPEGGREARRLGERSEKGHVDLPRLMEGGVDCQVFAIYTARQEGEPWALRTALRMIEAFNRECASNEAVTLAQSFEDIIKAVERGRIAAILSLEGAEPLMGDPTLLRIFHRLGVRMASLTWNWRNPFADGVGSKRAEGRLTEAGVEALREMERLGIVYDVSHLSDSCFWDVVELKEGPFIASHSNCRALCDHPRNLTDEMIRAIASRGGVVGVNFYPSFVCEGKATVERLVDHIDRVVELVGSDHVGLGSDFDGIGATPEGLEDASKMPNITGELIKRGYSERDVKKILGENFLRVFKEVLH